MMFYIRGLFVAFCLCFQFSFGQLDRPKLVVGIVVDQMRAEYLYRFQDNYSESGFKKMLREGFNIKNMHYNYVPTATGPGHASIFTGTTPSNHGIVANEWYNRERGQQVNCVEDAYSYLVDGTGVNKEPGHKDYSRSPINNRATTITDELKLHTNKRSKVIGISIKDRGAILPAGHLADYAFWYHKGTGSFITSSYYGDGLPDWLKEFNQMKLADSLLNETWNPLLPFKNYTHSGPDAAAFEKKYKGKTNSTFPYPLKKLRKHNGNFSLLPETPFGNSLLTSLAMATIDGEQLGMRQEIDFLTISYSSTDYVGHHFGIRSKELEDTYVRMDREISILLKFLDDKIGKNNYLLFLTADHAAGDHPIFLKENRLSGSFYSTKKLKSDTNQNLSAKFGKKEYVLYADKTQLYLSEEVFSNNEIIEELYNQLSSYKGIKEVYWPRIYPKNGGAIGDFIKNSHFSERSGDVFLHFQPGWMEEREFGTTHGNAYNGDTHVPLLWYGHGISKGMSITHHTIDQIALTLSLMLDIPLPNTSARNPILEIFEE